METKRKKATPEWRIPVDEFLEAATSPPKKLNKELVKELRKKAIAALREHYGEFSIRLIKRLANDPTLQLMISGQLAAEGWQRHEDMDKLRNKRRLAIYLLNKRYDWEEKDLVDELELGPKQTRVVTSATRVVPPLIDLPKWDEAQAKRIMLENHKEHKRREDVAQEAREYRDSLMLSLLRNRDINPFTGQSWYPAEVARVSNTTPQMVAVTLNPNTPSRAKKRIPKDAKAA